MSKAKLSGLMLELQKKFGDQRVMWASDIPEGVPISTGSLALNYATGYGGLPANRVVEICGQEGTGKTTLALLTMMSALDKYPQRGALILDVEHKMTKDWLVPIVGKERLENRVIYIQPTSIEEATNIYRQAVASDQVCIAILDSIGGSPTIRRNENAEVGNYGGNSIGVGEFARSAATMSATYNCLTIGVNQTRVDMSGYSRLNTPGGNAWKHACIMRIELVRGSAAEVETITVPGEKKPVPIGYIVYAKVRKNQVGPPGRVAMYWFFNVWTERFGFGIDTLDEITRLGVKTKVLKQNGSWYQHPLFPADKQGVNQVQGLLKVQEIVKDNESIRNELSKEIMAAIPAHGADVAPMTDPEAPVSFQPGAMLLEGTVS